MTAVQPGGEPARPDPTLPARLIALGSTALTEGFALIGFETHPDPTPEVLEDLLRDLLRRQQAALEGQLQATVAQALPGAPAVLDPGVQMRRALDQARQRTGAATSDGLEVLMGRAAQVLAGARPLALDFHPGRLSLRMASGQAAAASQRCQEQGLPCSVEGSSLLVSASD